MRTAAIAAALLGLSCSAVLAQAQPTPRPAIPQPTKPPAPKAEAPAQSRPAPTRATMTVLVTDRQGEALADVEVGVTGAMERDGKTDAEGKAVFRNMGAGNYRLRFEHPAFVTLEREVSMVAGRALKTSAALNPAPSPPPAPEEPAAPPPTPTPELPPPGSQPATSLSIPEVFEANVIGRNPSKATAVGCAGAATATLIQLREPLAEHTHDDADEALYVVAGEGIGRVSGRDVSLSPGTLVMVPRGTPHTIMRQGRPPVLVLLSILSGPPCTAK